jgi:hypothetical protein
MNKFKESSSLFKLLLVLSISVLLFGCNKQSNYRVLLKNPSQLQSRLQACSLTQSRMQTKSCQEAKAAQQAITSFIIVRNEQLLRFPGVQETLTNYQKLEKRAATTANKSLRKKIKADLINANLYYQSVGENYGKKVMASELALSQYKNKYKQLRQLISSDKSTAQQQAQLRQVKQKIVQTQQLTEAMLTLVHLNSGSQ